eukprot:9352648-Alexandrium_andersonii.AAC.1
MSASLVGSEMCIRDSLPRALAAALCPAPAGGRGEAAGGGFGSPALPAVSYTHLTLPTICSV